MNDYYEVGARLLITVGIIIGVLLPSVTRMIADWISRMQLDKGRQETNDRLEQMSKQIGYLADQNEKLPHSDSFLKLSNQLETLEKVISEKESVRQARSLEAATPKNDSPKEYVNGAAKEQ